MERIVIEVAPKVAKAWRKLSPGKRKEIGKKAAKQIGEGVLENDPTKDYLNYLTQLRTKMLQRGLTQEILDEILSEKN